MSKCTPETVANAANDPGKTDKPAGQEGHSRDPKQRGRQLLHVWAVEPSPDKKKKKQPREDQNNHRQSADKLASRLPCPSSDRHKQTETSNGWGGIFQVVHRLIPVLDAA